MSKKILKRSLALGALMAFVITGSAWAGCVLNNVGNSGVRHDEFKYSSTTLKDNYTLNGNISWSGYYPTSSNPDYNTTYLNGYKLTIISDTCAVHHGRHYDYKGGSGDSAFTVCEESGYKFVSEDGEKLGSLEINSTNMALHGFGIIDVDSLKLVSQSGNTIQSGDADGDPNLRPDYKTEIYANTIEIENYGSIPLMIYNQMEIGKENDRVSKLTISGDYGRAIRVTGDVDVNIYAEILNIKGATQTTKVDRKGTLNLYANGGEIVNDFEAASTGTIDVKFGAGVNWEGAFTTAEDGSGNVTLNGATWKVTANSNITTLAGNDGKIELAAAPATYSLRSANNGFVTLQIGDASNSGAEITGEGLTEKVESGELTAEEALEQLSDSVEVEKGSATLTLEEGDTVGKTTTTVDAEGNVGTLKQDVNTKAAKVSKAATNLKAHYRAHMNDMNKRMGELRMANGEAGVWTRMVRGESEYEGAKMQYNQYQLGYDEKLSVDKRWTVGAAVTFAEGDGSYGQGSTDDKSTAFAIYGTKLNNDGTFVDLIARYAHLKSDMEDSVYGNGDYSTNGYSVSAEFGKRIQQGNGLWVEPQVELTYGTIDSANFKLGTDYNAHFDSMDSFIARVGFSIGKDIKEGNVYARASYLYDFDGETTSLVTTTAGAGTPTPEDFGGGWWEVGVGANINLSKATYIYADIEKTFGGEVDTNWQWNLGVRYSF